MIYPSTLLTWPFQGAKLSLHASLFTVEHPGVYHAF